ncbi:MAG: hypothetical protein A2Z14_04850 [Chloroflexi bacterium RBG_16_48_8]|nr:MAG: hypothetical protein A2Z14_04850 [Chloroflexi bacterium RBG_16_48_8]
MNTSRIVINTIESLTLKDNALKDPYTRPLAIYLPPNYEDGEDRFPTSYLLAGFTGTGLTFLNHQAWEEDIRSRLDRLIYTGECKPMIVVMPDCFTRYGGSQYLDSPATGHYQSYLLEIVEYVDRHFRTLADRDHRVILGKSSGGYGALMNAMQHPEIFGLVADHSGDKYFEKCYAKDLFELPNLLNRMDVGAILANPSVVHPKGTDFYQLMSISAMAACYSPNPKSKLGFDWPIDGYTGERIPETWQKWVAKDPVEILSDYVEPLKSLRLLFFDCGNRDEYYIHLGCRLMEKRLKQLDIPHIYEEYEGGHHHTLFRFDRSFHVISEALPA